MSKHGNTLYKALQKFPRKRISLEELSRFCTGSEHLYEQINDLVERGSLTPIKSSGTNGNQKNPLFMRYNICIELWGLNVETQAECKKNIEKLTAR